MTGGSLPAQTWHDIMLAAHQGVEVKEIPGVGMGQKLPPTPAAAAMAAAGAPKTLDTKPAGPPPVLTKRGADILVRVEKLLDEAGKAAAKTSASEPPKATKPLSSSSVAFPDSFAAATPGQPAPPAPRKN
jgi:penicillin-binding protein 1A